MCGITGIFRLDGRPIQNADKRIRRMTSLLEHRGPDSQGIYLSSDGFLALGNTRLAIVDPQNNLHQPLETRDGGAVLSFNGEIYNYESEMRHLQQKGIRFQSQMDTEMLLEGLKSEGENFLEHLDGMWSFAYYEPFSRQLLLSRDLMGERHLFYRVCDGELVFASEVGPILADSEDVFKIDFESFLTSLQYFAPPPGRTMVEGVQRMLPGHNIRAQVGGEVRQYRFKKLHPEKWFDFFRAEPSLDSVIDLFGQVFSETSERRLPKEVPYFCTLSGGLDSALICLFASNFGRRPLQTLYGQSFEKPPCNPEDALDEFAASQFTSQKLHTEHNHIFINNEDAIPVLTSLAGNAFDGMFDSGVAAFEMLSRYVQSRKNKVILVAEGPDEFLGYPKDLKAHLSDSQATSFHFVPIHESWGPDLLKPILTDSQIRNTSGFYGICDPAYDNILKEMDYTQWRALSYAAFSLPDMFNLRIDKAYMKSSVEARLPFQAPQLAELLIAMPARFRFGDGKTTKFLMREIASRHIGPEIATRSKYGFAAPIWLSPKIFKTMCYEEVVRFSPIFDLFPFKSGVREHILKPENKDMLWPFFVLTKTVESLQKRYYKQ